MRLSTVLVYHKYDVELLPLKIKERDILIYSSKTLILKCKAEKPRGEFKCLNLKGFVCLFVCFMFVCFFYSIIC